MALQDSNQFREQLVEQVVHVVLPESKSPEEVSVAVQSFLDNNLTYELLILLEKILLHSQEFQSFKKLQNLLIFTAMRTE